MGAARLTPKADSTLQPPAIALVFHKMRIAKNELKQGRIRPIPPQLD